MKLLLAQFWCQLLYRCVITRQRCSGNINQTHLKVYLKKTSNAFKNKKGELHSGKSTFVLSKSFFLTRGMGAMRKFLVINYLIIHQNVFDSSCQRAWDTSKGGWPFGAAKTRVLRRTQHLWIEGKNMY